MSATVSSPPLLLRRLCAALLTVVFLAAPAAFGAQLWQCRVMDSVHLSACCPAPAPGFARVAPTATMQEAACCAVLESEAPAPSVTRDSARADQALAVFRVPVPSIAMPAVAPRWVQAKQPPCSAHPPTGPPLYTRHCSFLL